ncbi:hypothetical protein PROQFM164_S01g003301 [Penicillium roqueforti FM164]|uniref:Uncharacterized protein n=1 Tax=Penicillium roqueforti (strain FM164) TaxID=1365484 RepID=W6Q5J7_PENRF|nr:hypothetical protein PROQFM164_S01g003301 [Penicillium roqueforti FM164]
MSTCGRVPSYLPIGTGLGRELAVGIRGGPIRGDHAIPLYRVMQLVNSGRIMYSDWLICQELAAQLYALGVARHLDPPSADETPRAPRQRAAPADVARHCDWLVADPESREFRIESLKARELEV